MTQKIVSLVAVLLVSCFVACKSNDDAKITTEVKTKIMDDERLDAANVNVDTREGVVTLTGKVLGQEEESRAIEIARSVPGVANVVSKLDVETRIGNSEVEERVEENEEVAQEKLDETHKDNSIGDRIDDASITARVKLAFAKDPAVSAYKLDVDTSRGIVTLSGPVKTSTEAQRAISVAESVHGVKQVNSVLTVGS